MGRMNAIGFAASVAEGIITLDMALGWHLSVNHYPPIPGEMIPACKAAIEAGNDGEYDRLIQLPEGVVHRVHGDKVPAREIIEHAHLDSFIQQERGEDEPDPDCKECDGSGEVEGRCMVPDDERYGAWGMWPCQKCFPRLYN